MIRPIVLYGSSILRQVAPPVPSEYTALHALVKDMFETMHAASGVGLAAPQVGTLLQLFLVSGRFGEEPGLIHYQEVFINPKILSTNPEEGDYEEGCLSIPYVRRQIQRPTHVHISYENLHREPKELHADGLLARIIQHEYDHLQGVLFIDHLSALQKRTLKKKLSSISEKESYPYPVVLQKP